MCRMDVEEDLEEAGLVLDEFAGYSAYRHGKANPHLKWLTSVERLPAVRVIDFLNFWYPVSRHQPQILLLCASAFPERDDRRHIIEWNYLEEDGLAKTSHDAHYDLLAQLITKLGGLVEPSPVSERLVSDFHQELWRGLSPAAAAGTLAGIEHPALDISEYFRNSVKACGHEPLLETDPYLTIHVVVEPRHIIDTHGTAQTYMKRSQKERREVIAAFREVTMFWKKFWAKAFVVLGEE